MLCCRHHQAKDPNRERVGDRNMKLLLQICVHAGGVLVASLAAAQPIEGIIPDSVRSYYQTKCSAELATMLSSWNSVGQNGPALDQYYYNVSRMDASGVREQARLYLAGPGVIERRWNTDQYRATNIWENCLVNAREQQLGLSITQFNVPPPAPSRPPAPPAEAGEEYTDADGNTQYRMADGSNCVRVQTSQARSPSRPGYFDQQVSMRNKCDRDIEVRVCKPDGSCVNLVSNRTSTTIATLGTTEGLDPDWQLNPTGQAPQQIVVAPPQPPQVPPTPVPSSGVDNTPIDFGDDSSQWAHDGECDDPRFSGPGSAAELAEADYFRDASDCRAAVAAGTVVFTGYTDRGQSTSPVQSQDAGDSFGLQDALDIFSQAVDMYIDIENARNGVSADGDAGTYPDGSDYEEDYNAEVDNAEDDCDFNSDSDPTTVCTVQ